MAHAAETFDFIVTGAGSAGCAVAARLSESGRYTVLLLEAGPPDTNRWIHIPLGAAKVFVDASVNWRFETEPVESLNGRTLYQPRGKVLGGTSSINGTVYMRGTPGDYNQWRQMGCTGWDWDSVLPFFKKAEDQERGPSELHGTGGPLRVSNIPTEYELPAAMIAAAEQAGIPRNPDFNGPTQEGTGYYQFTASKTKRWSSARAYLEPAKARENLKIETNAHTTRIVLTDGRASGVVFRQDSIERTAHARREVIISGGAFGSPHLLQLSGIGPAAVLQSHGIAVQHDLAGVGENLQDHFNTYIPYRCAKPVTANDLAISMRRRLMAGAQYLLFGKGMMANTGVHAGAFVRSDPSLERPDLQMNFLPWGTKGRTAAGVEVYPFSAFCISPVHLRPEGRGQVRLKSPDPLAAPAIHYEFLKTEYDRRAILYGVRLAREIARQAALAGYTLGEITPGADVTDDEGLLEDVRNRAVANYHPVGTCRMGVGNDAVVDPGLRLHGIDGLRVADASIMPMIPAGNTNAPSIMIGEKCAAMVLEDAM